jgi:predicted RNase H-like HicB family nuclease
MSTSGYGASAVLQLIGISYRQLDHWARTGLVRSSVKQASGRGSRRVYSFQDLVALRVVGQLREAGVSVQTIRKAVAYLKLHDEQPLSTLNLVGHGNKVFSLTDDPSKLVEASENGQVVMSISVASLERHLREGVTRISAPRDVTVRVRGKTYRAVFTPDLEVGGYTVEVPELPGCITEGDDLAEAKRMTKEAIEAWLSVAEPAKARSRAKPG